MMHVEPNSTRCKVKILEMETSKTFGDKLMLKVEILPWSLQKDQRFIKPGEKMAAFTYEGKDLQVNDIVTADAEYIGGPTVGQIQLTRFQKAEGE